MRKERRTGEANADSDPALFVYAKNAGNHCAATVLCLHLFPHTRNVKLTKYYIKKLQKCRKSHGLDIIYKNLVSLNFKAFSKYLV